MSLHHLLTAAQTHTLIIVLSLGALALIVGVWIAVANRSNADEDPDFWRED